MTIYERRPDQVEAHAWTGFLGDTRLIVERTRATEFHTAKTPEIINGGRAVHTTWVLTLTIDDFSHTLHEGDVIYREQGGPWQVEKAEAFAQTWRRAE